MSFTFCSFTIFSPFFFTISVSHLTSGPDNCTNNVLRLWNNVSGKAHLITFVQQVFKVSYGPSKAGVRMTMNNLIPKSVLIATLAILLIYNSSIAQVTIWSEDFNSYPDGTMNAAPKWTSTATDCDDGGNLNLGPGQSLWGVYAGRFTVNDIEGAPCCAFPGPGTGGGNGNFWTSQLINIATFCNISVSIDISYLAPTGLECSSSGSPIYTCSGTTPPDNSHDQITGEYSIDGGPFVLFGYGCDTPPSSFQISGLNGASTIQIRISAANKANDEYYYFDNILVKGFNNTPITITGVPNTICNTAGAYNLPTQISGINGNWSGPNVAGNQFFPNTLGPNTLTFTPSSCALPANWTINVVPSIPVSASSNSPICGGDTLRLYADSIGGASYTWAGPLAFNANGPNVIRTATIALMSGTYTVTMSVGACSSTASTNVTIFNQPQAFSYNTTPICSGTAGVYLNLSSYDNNVKAGGPGVVSWFHDGGATNAIIRPDSFLVSDTLIVYARVNNGGCNSAVVPVRLNVSKSKTPNIKTIALCRNTGVYDLRNLRDSAYLAGTWSWTGPINGSGNFFNTIMPAGNYTMTFTASGACVLPATFVLPLNDPGPVLITDLPSSVCATSGSVVLSTTQNGVKGKWSGGAYISSDSIFNPAGLSGPISVTFTPNAGQCGTANSGTIDVKSVVTIAITALPDSICRNAAPVNLPSSQSGITGTWGGPGVSGFQFNPASLTGLHLISFFPNAGQCAAGSSKKVTVNTPVKPVLSGVPLTYCQSDSSVLLPVLQDGLAGNWSGQGVSSNRFYPTGLTDTIILKFTPTGSVCADTNTLAVRVFVPSSAKLDSANLCQSDAAINLSSLSDPLYPSGKWSGAGLDTLNNTFSPAGKAGNYPITFTSNTFCTKPVQTLVTVRVPATPKLSSDTLCQSESPVSLSKLLDPLFPTGAWNGLGVKNDTFNPGGLSGNIPITFQSNAACTQISSAVIWVNKTPVITNLEENCNLVTQEYTVKFSIRDGDSTSYKVNGIPSGNLFVSNPYPSDSNYTITVDDKNGCGPVSIMGSPDCSCVSFAGQMDFNGSAYKVCEGRSFTAVHLKNQILEPEDTLVFILHDAAGTTLGNVLASSPTPTFSYPAGVVIGKTYYISAVAGNKLPDGVDLSDPCLSVSQGVPLVYYSLNLSVSAADTICSNSCHTLNLTFEGVGPFMLTYRLQLNSGFILDTIRTDSTNFKLVICPESLGINSGEIVFQPRVLLDSNCFRNLDSSLIREIGVFPKSTKTITTSLCAGDSMVVNNKVYNAANPVGSEVLIGQSFWGCDSLVQINLSFHPKAESFQTPVLCLGDTLSFQGQIFHESKRAGTIVLKNQAATGCDSLVHVSTKLVSSLPSSVIRTICSTDSIEVNGTFYGPSKPAGLEIIPNGSYLGCDSTINVFLSFTPPTVGNLSMTLCPGDSLVVNGLTFKQANPSGTTVLPKQNYLGCDSILNVNLTFRPPIVSNFNPTLCTGETRMVNGTVYNQANPIGTEIFKKAASNGCDSIVNINLSYFPAAESFNSFTICQGDSLILHGQKFDRFRTSGKIILNGMAASGCDSTINVQLSVNPVGTSTYAPILCDGDTLFYHGRIFHKSQASGSIVLSKASQFGCDSIISVNLSFYPKPSLNLNPTLCIGDSVLVNGKVYNHLKPSGTEIISKGSYLGCDSIVNVNLTYRQPVITNINQQLCPGGLVVVNNVKYDSFNPKGTEILKKAAANGCDSIVNINLTFGTSVIVNINRTLCFGDSIKVKNTWYSSLNSNGTETFPNGSYLGCDSIVNVSLTFQKLAISSLDTTLKQGETILVNNTVYSQHRKSGSEVIKGGSYTGCDSIVLVTLRFEGIFEPQIKVKAPLCKRGRDGSITIDTIVGGIKPYVVALNGANSKQVFSFPFVFSGVTGGLHQLTIQDNAGVIVVINQLVDEPAALLLELGPNPTVPLGQDFTIKPQTSFVATKWVWSPPDFLSCTDCPSPVVRNPNQEITYTVVATDASGCSVTDRITIFVNRARTIFVPNTFSPNGDGINDKLVVFGGKEVARIKAFKVFNRWGGLIYEAYDLLPNDYNMGWDGFFRGERMNSGLYTWFAEVEFVDGQTELFEGGVHLMR